MVNNGASRGCEIRSWTCLLDVTTRRRAVAVLVLLCGVVPCGEAAEDSGRREAAAERLGKVVGHLASDELQGRGIGTALLATCLQTMRRRGLHTAFVLWTSDETAERVYGRFGFTGTRRFAVLRRAL